MMNTDMTKIDFNGHFGTSGVILLSVFLPKCT
jgi:hypothetical protein